jgi:RND family efflux transporter MFP subunit
MKNLRIYLVPLLVAALLLPACKEEVVKKEVIRPVKSVRVPAQVQMLSGRSFPGKATATQQTNLAFRVAGPLVEFPAQVGDEVKKGDVLARIDPRDFQVELRNVQGQLKRTQAMLEVATSDYDRVTRVAAKDPGAISEAMIDAKKGELDSAKAQLQSLQASVATARDNLNYTYLKASYDGTVVETFVENFEDVQAKQAIIRLVDTRKMEFTVNIPESLISRVADVEVVLVRFDAFPDYEIPATVKEVGKEASKTTRTYPVTLIMDQPDGLRVLPGMAGIAWADKVSAVLAKDTTGGVPVPVAATFTENGKSYVWIINEDSMMVSRQEITLAVVTNDGVTVSGGLEGGELIVSAGAHSVVEGQKVRFLEE